MLIPNKEIFNFSHYKALLKQLFIKKLFQYGIDKDAQFAQEYLIRFNTFELLTHFFQIIFSPRQS